MAGVRKKRAKSPKIRPQGAKSISPNKTTRLQKMLEKNGSAVVNPKRITTRSIGKENPPETQSEVLPAREVGIPYGEVNVAYGLTIGLARKFEFARIDVGVRVPCTNDNREASYEEARKWAQEKIKLEVQAVRESESKPKDDDSGL